MTLSIDLFWSFRSPYSYLATPRLVEMTRDYDLQIKTRPVYPLAVRKAEFFDQVNPQWIPYLLRDTFRIAQMQGLDYRWPRPDPVKVNPDTRHAVPDQPYIHRLTRLGCAAEEARPRAGLPRRGQPRDLGRHRELARRRPSGQGHEARRARPGRARRPDRSRSGQIRGHHPGQSDAHHAAGHWGVPTMVFADEPFFGQDRLDVLLWRLEENGLQERNI